MRGNSVVTNKQIGVLPTTVAARSKVWICDRSHSGIVGSKPAGPRISVCCEWCVL